MRRRTSPGAATSAVISHGLWQREFGGRRNVLGQQIVLDGRAHTIVGVASEEFFFPTRQTELWTPLVLERGQTPRDQRDLLVMARLRKGVSATRATAEMRTVAQRLAGTYPDTNRGWTATVETVRDNLRSGASLALTVLYGSITFVLLIACANVANLLLARAADREKEIAMRTTLGARRGRVIRQLLTESVVLASLGGGLGFVFSLWGIRVLRNMLAPDVNIGFIAEEIGMNVAVLLHALVISIAAGVIFGLAPALSLSRLDLQAILKQGGRSGGGVRRRTFRSALVVAEVAMALALLGTAGALIRAFHHLYTVDPGFNPRGLLTFQLSLPETEYAEAHEVLAFYRQALAELDAIPGVERATTTTTLPLTLLPGAATVHLRVEGAGDEHAEETPNAIDVVVGSDYFATLEISLLRGRGLTEEDREATRPVAVVSQAAVERFWPEGDPLGTRFRLGGREARRPWITVVGVVEDVHTNAHSLRTPTPRMPNVFLPLAQNPRSTTSVVLRTRVPPPSIAGDVRRAIWQIDPRQPVENLLTMEEVIARVDTQNFFFIRVLTGLAAIAMVLAAAGIYSVISYAVSQRTREIGMRMALGAQARNIIALVVREAVLLTAIGFVFGFAVSVAFVRFAGSQLEGIAMSNAAGPLTWVVVSAVLVAVAQIASFVPARRAVRTDPVEALRNE